jgi:diguanylate cyclase (GGDEF)-like protein
MPQPEASRAPVLAVAAASPRLSMATPIEQADIRDFSRTVAEIEWLLVILVLVYHFFRATNDDNALQIYGGMMAFALAVVVIHYLNAIPRRGRWRLATETWLMIVFITWIIYHTGRLDSPLFNLFMLPVIVSALTLGQAVTLLQIGLVAACYLFLGYSTGTPLTAANFAADLAPMLLVAYITSMLSTDILNAMSRIKLISETDALTGIYNPRAFDAIAAREFTVASRYNRAFSLLMIDSDSLKTINDTHGHEAGDDLIRMTARAIRDVIKATDIVARRGGDEFICLCPDTDRDSGKAIAERIRKRIESAPLRVAGKTVRTTVSIGMVTFPGHGTSFDVLARNADKALYASKNAGRNCVTVYSAALTRA